MVHWWQNRKGGLFLRVFLAIDIGASSGRHIAGWLENGTVHTEEIYRFPNRVSNADAHLVWNIKALFSHVKKGIQMAFIKYGSIESLSIDTWGVDYVLMKKNKAVQPCYAYRDNRTLKTVEFVHDLVPFEELYRRTGCQYQPFNSIYQLCVDYSKGRLEDVTDALMIPEYLLYKLTGVKVREYTNATTTGLVSAQTGEFDMELVDKLGLPRTLFPKLSQPGTVLGRLQPRIAREVGGNCKVVLCATHDTASAVEGIPMEGNELYISSGTWSLLGVKTPKPITNKESELANYSNEGGVGYNRYQKNIMGMWLVNQLQKELCPELSFPEIVDLAEQSSCTALVDANADAFLSPKSMKAAFDEATAGSLNSVGDYFCCAYRSLAASYQKAIQELEANTGMNYQKLYIVGGGAKNLFLNRLTEEATGKQVVALPIEATALGNLKIQMEVT